MASKSNMAAIVKYQLIQENTIISLHNDNTREEVTTPSDTT